MAYRDDLTAAVARAEAAERALAAVCHIHTGTPSTSECAACKRRFCDACVTASDAGLLCTTCFVAHTSRRRRRTLLGVAAGVAVAAAGVVGFVALGSKKKDDAVAKALGIVPPPTEKPKYGKRPNRIRVLRETLAGDACNRDAALELAELLNENLAYPETIEANRRFLDKCGPFPRLVWTSVYAHEQRSEWAPAVELTTGLIQGEPTDSDFWWWRGQDRTELGLLEEAAADYRQAIGLGGQKFATFRFAALAEKMHKPCEGAFAIRDMVAVDFGGEFGDSWERFKQLYSAGACDDVTGHGKAVIKFKPEMPFVTAKVTVGDKTGNFVVDPSAGQLTLGKDFAAAAGLTGKTAVTTYVMGELREAKTAVVDQASIDGASATLVDAVIVDSLAPGLDGVVGMSFMWRFRVDRDDAKGELTLTGWGP